MSEYAIVAPSDFHLNRRHPLAVPKGDQTRTCTDETEPERVPKPTDPDRCLQALINLSTTNVLSDKCHGRVSIDFKEICQGRLEMGE